MRRATVAGLQILSALTFSAAPMSEAWGQGMEVSGPYEDMGRGLARIVQACVGSQISNVKLKPAIQAGLPIAHICQCATERWIISDSASGGMSPDRVVSTSFYVGLIKYCVTKAPL